MSNREDASGHKPCTCGEADCPICNCKRCKGSGLVTIYNYDGNGSDADDQPCQSCALEREVAGE